MPAREAARRPRGDSVGGSGARPGSYPPCSSSPDTCHPSSRPPVGPRPRRYRRGRARDPVPAPSSRRFLSGSSGAAAPSRPVACAACAHWSSPAVPAPGCGRSPTRRPSSWCRSLTSRCCSTAWRRSATPGSPTSASWSATPSPRSGRRSATAQRSGIRATYLRQDAPRGLAHAVLIAQDFLGDEPFVMYLGDNLIIGGITEPRGRASPLAATTRRSCSPRSTTPSSSASPSSTRRARSSGSRRSRRSRRATWPSSASTCSVRTIHEAVRAIAPSARGELEITDAIQWLIDQGYDVRRHLVTGYWKDTGRLDDMLDTNRKVLESRRAVRRPDAHGRRGQPHRRPGGGRGGRSDRPLDRPRPGRDRPQHPDRRHLHRAVHLDLPRLRDRGPPRSSTRSCSSAAGSASISRIEDSLIGRDVEVMPCQALPNAPPADAR